MSFATGGAVSRFTATGTQVTAGAGSHRRLRQHQRRHRASPPRFARITVFNTATGDKAGTVDFAGNPHESHVLPSQEIRFNYDLDIDGTRYRSDTAKLAPATRRATRWPFRPAV